MESFENFCREAFKNQRESWESNLIAELKIQDIGNKAFKKTIDGGVWPTLSLENSIEVHMPPTRAWKKASQTYIRVPSASIQEWLEADLASGVRAFFIDKDFIEESCWMKIQDTLNAYPKKDEVEVILLGKKKFSKSNILKVIDEESMAMAREVHDRGGNNIQELGLLTLKMIESLKDNNELNFGLFMDSNFFKNIAKTRALKLLIEKVLYETKTKKDYKVLALTSFREWTLFERYSNMLRNNASLASGYIAGADLVQSAGYQSVFEYETTEVDAEHAERSQRMARNSSHILALESMLGVVQDAAYGSFHLEALTQDYASKAWTLMQELLPMNQNERKDYLEAEVSQVRTERLNLLKTRKTVLAGINDFPDVKEVLKVSEIKDLFFRTGRDFEKLRLTMSNASKKPEVYIALYGDYASLNARVNFVKNYFELLGLKVSESGVGENNLEKFKEKLLQRSEEIIVLCATDENYEVLKDEVSGIKAPEKFIAGKHELTGFKALHAGQNVYEVLESLVKRWGK